MTQRRGFKALVAGIALALGASTGVSAAAVTSPASKPTKGTRWDSVIVSAKAGHLRDAALSVQRAGGAVGSSIPLIEGFSAKVPAGSERTLRLAAGVRSVTPNSRIHFDTHTFDASTTATNPVRSTKASSLWNAGGYGQGVGVAVVDTGISPSADVNGRVVYGPDLSGEGTLVDTFGHGTVMSGIIGGDGSQSASGGHPYTGLAPKSTLIAVKAAGANGATDVTTILQALNWVSAYASQYNIRVLNLSMGFGSTQSYLLDPVDYAVERLWNQGIVVVVSAGNSGPSSGTITTPGSDPMVLTVGAYDDKQNSTLSDDAVTAWSSEGPTQSFVAKPDIVAPGRTVISTRSHASTIEQENPQALIGDGYIKGSGTSQAAAVTSGVVADMLSLRPGLSPDQVKNLLKNNATPIAGTSANAQGAGRLTIPAGFQVTPAGSVNTQPSLATGLGSLEASRGGVDYGTTLAGASVSISGEIDTKGEAWNGSQWTGSQWTGSQWTGSQWTGSQWTGSQWTGSQWTNAVWNGSQWTGGQWNGGSWQGSQWTGSQWTGSQWTGSQWTGSQWTGSQWTGSQWTGGTWDGSQWTGSQWTGSQWTGSQWTGSQWTDGAWEDAFWGDAPPGYAPLPGEPTLDNATSSLELLAHQAVDQRLGLL